MSKEEDLDHLCMLRLVQGDDFALNELMERWEKPLLSFVLRYVGNYTDAVDIAAETFSRVYHNRGRFNFKSKFSTWLLTIATNLCRHHARWRTRHPTISLHDAAAMQGVSEESAFSSDEETPASLAERSELSNLVQKEIAKLPADLKTVIILFEYNNLSYSEIGLILGCTAKAVETRLYRARKMLANRLAPIA
jgi:RNA polymerase sigma factor (sigma-70 family)